MTTNDRCQHCGAKMNKYWHRLTPVMVRALVKTLQVVRDQDNNHVQISDVDLSHSEYGNYQKLRYHGLIAKHHDDEGNFDGWLITKRGGQFLRGEVCLPLRVQTFRNRVVEHDSQLVYISDVIGHTPFTQLDFSPEPATSAEIEQVVLFPK